MGENKQDQAVAGEVNRAPVESAPAAAPQAEAPKRPPTIEEVEKKHFNENHATRPARELERRQQIDADKKPEDVKAGYGAKVEEQKKIDQGTPDTAAHANDPGLETSKN